MRATVKNSSVARYYGLLLLVLLGGCVDLTVTFRGPCRAVVLADSTATKPDTLYVLAVDSTVCPRG